MGAGMTDRNEDDRGDYCMWCNDFGHTTSTCTKKEEGKAFRRYTFLGSYRPRTAEEQAELERLHEQLTQVGRLTPERWPLDMPKLGKVFGES